MRRAGVLLHPTSLPSGVLDDQVERFLDWMEKTGLSVWQMLPLAPPHADRSPYQAYSSHGINPALLPPELTFRREDEEEFDAFKRTHTKWLTQYSLFVALRNHYGDRPWYEWPTAFKHHEQAALDRFAAEHFSAIELLQQKQFLLWRRWKEIHRDANRRGIQLLGDVPIAVAYDSANVWANLGLFKLDDELRPTVVAGVPPDYFSATGQRWGNPHYNWEAMQRNGFAWWRRRMATALYLFDIVRIDHFRGLVALWEIPADSPDGRTGQWVPTPGRELLEVLREDFPTMPFVAEDLGLITPEVTALRDEFNLPGLSVLQFGFDGTADNPHSIYNQKCNTIVYTGTHDNDTSLGWFESLDSDTQSKVLHQLPAHVGHMPWPLITAALESCAHTAIIPMQDWLELDSRSRTNVPGTTEGNWCWRFEWEQLGQGLEERISSLVQLSGRTQNR
ncbi:MAG: 4-alpha-glucanotransferase [Desulfuromonadaceae bacterium]|nr:4-alpha-glucanotransferase [Desulfuromonadaceae bacterium]